VSSPSTASSSEALSAEASIAAGRRVLAIEAAAVAALADRLGEDFARACALVAAASGRILCCGIGKSGHIARKVAGTLTSTGTPAVFLHPVEALHGDLGIVGSGDVAVLISKSGDVAEVGGLIEYLARVGVPIVALVGTRGARLSEHATVVLDCSVHEEACPMDLAPTSSTTAALAMGDALALAVLERKGFRPEDFAALHPGGALGRKLSVRVADVMIS
jgi:arabinose-5-phosphate isomerase